jgi:hypothetical protein
VLLSNPADFAGMNEEYARWFPVNPPTRYAASAGPSDHGVRRPWAVHEGECGRTGGERRRTWSADPVRRRNGLRHAWSFQASTSSSPVGGWRVLRWEACWPNLVWACWWSRRKSLKKWLRAPPVQPTTIAELQNLLDAFAETYNQDRPHRSLPNRATPATAYQARPKATPTSDRSTDSHDRVRHDTISKAGNATLRVAGRLRHIGVGRTYARTRVLMLVQDLHVRIANAATGELLRELTINPALDAPAPKPTSPDRENGIGAVGAAPPVTGWRLVAWCLTGAPAHRPDPCVLNLGDGLPGRSETLVPYGPRTLGRVSCCLWWS